METHEICTCFCIRLQLKSKRIINLKTNVIAYSLTFKINKHTNKYINILYVCNIFEFEIYIFTYVT